MLNQLNQSDTGEILRYWDHTELACNEITVTLQFQCGRELRGDNHDEGYSQLEWEGEAVSDKDATDPKMISGFSSTHL